LIGSLLLHIVLFVFATKMSSTTHVAMRAVEAIIVEPPVGRLPEQKQSIPPRSGADIHHGHAQEKDQLQPMHQGGESAAPPPAEHISTEVSPAHEAAVAAAPQLGQSMASARAVPDAAPVSLLSTHPQKDSSRKSSISSNQSSGTGQVMVWEDVGSPRFIHREPPIYPFMARRLGKEGKVVLKLALDAQGRLQKIDIVEANGFGFAEAASAAIRKSTFAPAVRNGSAIPSEVLVPVRFVLHEGQ
jgi:protein TonB